MNLHNFLFTLTPLLLKMCLILLRPRGDLACFDLKNLIILLHHLGPLCLLDFLNLGIFLLMLLRTLLKCLCPLNFGDLILLISLFHLLGVNLYPLLVRICLILASPAGLLALLDLNNLMNLTHHLGILLTDLLLKERMCLLSLL